jgi:hypothetical protein
VPEEENFSAHQPRGLVVDRCQRSGGVLFRDSSMRQDDLRPRAIITSSDRAKGAPEGIPAREL